MYFINFAKCSICQQKKSVATKKNETQKVCKDCNLEFYEVVSSMQKDNWVSRNSNTKK